mgnify:CR=1 FL=1
MNTRSCRRSDVRISSIDNGAPARSNVRITARRSRSPEIGASPVFAPCSDGDADVPDADGSSTPRQWVVRRPKRKFTHRRCARVPRRASFPSFGFDRSLGDDEAIARPLPGWRSSPSFRIDGRCRTTGTISHCRSAWRCPSGRRRSNGDRACGVPWVLVLAAPPATDDGTGRPTESEGWEPRVNLRWTDPRPAAAAVPIDRIWKMETRAPTEVSTTTRVSVSFSARC